MKHAIYKYLDYRHYMADVFTALKQENPRYSKREFARAAGSTSPNFLQFIVGRKLHISDESIKKLSAFLRLSTKEHRYFKLLAEFDHAKTHEEKDRCFQHIISIRQSSPRKQLQDSQYAYLSHWYMPVIRELVTSPLYPDNPQWIADQIVPPITVSKARKGIRLLENLGLIRRDERSSCYHQTETVLSTCSEVMSITVINYYKGLLTLGREAIERFTPEERDIRGVTAGISLETYNKLKVRMESFWEEIMAAANEPQETERVYHVGLLLFPLSKGIKK